MTAAPFIGAAVGALGTVQYLTSRKRLNELSNQEFPEYSLTAGMKDSISDADAMRGIGYTAGEKAALGASLTRGENTAFRRAFSMAPSLSQALQAGINSVNIQGRLNMAAQDAQLMRQNLRYSDQLRGQEQNIQDRNDQVKIQRRIGQENAYGQAMQSGLNNMVNGLSLGLSGLGEGGKKQTAGQANGTTNAAPISGNRMITGAPSYAPPDELIAPPMQYAGVNDNTFYDYRAIPKLSY